MKIIRNMAKCKLCGDTIESKSVHDFQICSCNNLCVDGGKEYLRRQIRDGDKSYIELSKTVDN